MELEEYGAIGGMAGVVLALTAVLLQVTPACITKRLHGLPISVLCGMVVSLVWVFAYEGGMASVAVGIKACIRGFIVGTTAAGGWDGIKTSSLYIKKRNGGGEIGG